MQYSQLQHFYSIGACKVSGWPAQKRRLPLTEHSPDQIPQTCFEARQSADACNLTFIVAPAIVLAIQGPEQMHAVSPLLQSQSHSTCDRQPRADALQSHLCCRAKVIVLWVDSPQQQHSTDAGHKGQHKGDPAHELQRRASPNPCVVDQQIRWDHRVDDPDH